MKTKFTKRHTGTIEWFKENQGLGLITTVNRGKSSDSMVFVAWKDLLPKALKEQAKVKYNIEIRNGRKYAVNVKFLKKKVK